MKKQKLPTTIPAVMNPVSKRADLHRPNSRKLTTAGLKTAPTYSVASISPGFPADRQKVPALNK